MMTPAASSPATVLAATRAAHWLHGKRGALLAVGLLLLATLPWWYALDAQFIWIDDPDYIQKNPHVLGGFHWEGFKAAFTTTRGAMWMPLMWISLLADVSLYGPGPFGFHLTNVLLHIANALLLFLVLDQATRARGRSLAVALLWSIHPLRVESVAWATERKDVLALFFGLLAMVAYVRYARAARFNWGAYLAAGLLFACSLMSKPMLVTLPVVLLLLDFWPLGRWSREAGGVSAARLILEKVPLLGVAAGISAVTLILSAQGNHLAGREMVPLDYRIGNALIAMVLYLRDTFWFEQLAVFYPLRTVSVGGMVLASLLLAAISAAVVWAWRKGVEAGRPCLTGWTWFLVALLPVSGIFQIGDQSRADRFTYWPAIGLWIALVWLWPARPASRLLRAPAFPAALVFALAAMLGYHTVFRLKLWRDPALLALDAAERTAPNAAVEAQLGYQALRAGQFAAADAWYRRSLRSDPARAASHNDYAMCLATAGRMEEAWREASIAVELQPGAAQWRTSLAMIEAHLSAATGSAPGRQAP